MRSGPANEATIWASLYDGDGVGWFVKENGRASSAELPRRMPMPPLESERAFRRLLPKAASCANGDAAPFLTLPLIRNPSAPPRSASPAAVGSLTTAAPPVDGFTCAR